MNEQSAQVSAVASDSRTNSADARNGAVGSSGGSVQMQAGSSPQTSKKCGLDTGARGWRWVLQSN